MISIFRAGFLTLRYDRQIHIWGAEKQKRIIQTTILFVNGDPLCAEVVRLCDVGV